VVRLGYVTGQVSFLPAGATDWVQADLNRPLWTGDQLWTGPDARAELQMGNAVLRLAPGTSVSVTAFDDKTEQLQVAQGTARLRVLSMDRDDVIELDTPNLAFAIREPGDYRVDVDASTTTVGVSRGAAEAFGTQNAYTIDAGSRVRFSGTDLADYQPVALGRADTFDTWVGERTAHYEQSASARYVAPDVIGYQDLDSYGSWQQVPTYGNVWVPTSVAPDWAPYRSGHWVWLDPWGWTWVDDAPWGFTPYHYGRWAFVDSRWCWVPGPRTVRAVYAPALVGFVGAPNLGVSVAVGVGAGVAWFPLGPGDVYRPAYAVSRDYFTRVNVTNTVVNVTQVTNIYNNPTRTDIRYVNVERPNAVTAVPTQAFVEARPVQRAAVKVDARALQNATVLAAPARVAPERASIVGAAPAQARPAPAVAERNVIAKNTPPPPPASIERRQEALKRDPGKPLDTAELQRLAPAQAKPNVRVSQPSVAPKPLPAVAAAPAEKGKAANEKESPPPTARVQNEPPKAEAPKAGQPEPARPNGQQPPRGEPPAVAEKQNQPPGQVARPEPRGRPQPVAPPTQEAQPRGAPGATPPSAAEAQRAPQTAGARPEAAQRPTPPGQREREPLARPGQEAAPSTAQAPRPPQSATARPDAAPRATPPGQREREPEQRPAPQRPQPEQQARSPQSAAPAAPTPPPQETTRAAPRTQPQPPRAPETAQAPRAQPQPPRAPETTQAPQARPRPQQPPREAPEPQAAAPRGPEFRPQSAQPQRAEPAPQQRAQQPKGKGNEQEKEKDKKDDGGK
jgi:hypothetical protein